VTFYASDSGSQTAFSQQTVIVASSQPSSSTYILAWQGYDWDGGQEETIHLNGLFVASLPSTGISANGGTWASFSLNITSFVVKGTNTLTFTHAGWDCGASDNVRNLQVTSGTGVVYANSTSYPLSCTQSLTYTFNIGTAPPPPHLRLEFRGRLNRLRSLCDSYLFCGRQLHCYINCDRLGHSNRQQADSDKVCGRYRSVSSATGRLHHLFSNKPCRGPNHHLQRECDGRRFSLQLQLEFWRWLNRHRPVYESQLFCSGDLYSNRQSIRLCISCTNGH